MRYIELQFQHYTYENLSTVVIYAIFVFLKFNYEQRNSKVF